MRVAALDTVERKKIVIKGTYWLGIMENSLCKLSFGERACPNPLPTHKWCSGCYNPHGQSLMQAGLPLVWGIWTVR